MKGSLSSRMARIAGKMYLVRDYPFDPYRRGPLTDGEYASLSKGVAYHYRTELEDRIYPFHGHIDRDEFDLANARPGLWFLETEDGHRLFIVRPRNQKEASDYEPGRSKDVVAAVVDGDYMADQFAENHLDAADIGTECYMPPVRATDGPLAMLMKTAIRLKKAPFGPYGRRLEGLAVNSEKGSTERSNWKGNARRTLQTAERLSSYKFGTFAGIWEMDWAVILGDRPGAMDPMDIPKNHYLIIFPGGKPFEIAPERLIDATDLVNQAIAETLTEEGRTDSKDARRSDDGETEDSGEE